MPTRNQSLEFVRKHKQLLRDAGLKNPSKLSSPELNRAIEKAIDTKGFPKEVRTEFLKMKLKHDQSPEGAQNLKKQLAKKELITGKAGGTTGYKETMKKDSVKATPVPLQKAGPGRPKKDAKLDAEIEALHKMSDKIQASKGFSVESYRKKPIKDHSIEARKEYVNVMRSKYKEFTKGKKVLVNHLGKNVVATIVKDMTPGNSSIEINWNGKVQRKDLATIYGFAKGGTKEDEVRPAEKAKGANTKVVKTFSETKEKITFSPLHEGTMKGKRVLYRTIKGMPSKKFNRGDYSEFNVMVSGRHGEPAVDPLKKYKGGFKKLSDINNELLSNKILGQITKK